MLFKTSGYKPFTAKQLILKASKQGNVVCEFNIYFIQSYNKRIKREIVQDAIEFVLTKVDDVIDNDARDKFDKVNRNNFEIINENDDYDYLDKDINEYLDTINDLDLTDTTVSIDSCNEDLYGTDDERFLETDLSNDNSQIVSDELFNNIDDTNQRYFVLKITI